MSARRCNCGWQVGRTLLSVWMRRRARLPVLRVIASPTRNCAGAEFKNAAIANPARKADTMKCTLVFCLAALVAGAAVTETGPSGRIGPAAERAVHRRGRSQLSHRLLRRSAGQNAQPGPIGRPWRPLRPRLLPVSAVQSDTRLTALGTLSDDHRDDRLCTAGAAGPGLGHAAGAFPPEWLRSPAIGEDLSLPRADSLV